MFSDARFDPDDFVVNLLEKEGCENLRRAIASQRVDFDAEKMLSVLTTSMEELESLQADADIHLNEAVEIAERKGEKHKRTVHRLRQDADQILQGVQHLTDRMGNVGGKAMSIGKRLDKVERQRQRADEASRAITLFDMLCSADEAEAAEALEELVPGTTPQDLLKKARMLKKVEAVGRGAGEVEGQQRAVERVDGARQRLEQVALQVYDTAAEEYATNRSGALVQSMRASAESMEWFSGGGAVVQRHIASRAIFMDLELVTRDAECLANARSKSDALREVERVSEQVLSEVKAEAAFLPLVFPDADRVMALLLERLCTQRLCPTMETVLLQVREEEGRAGWLACITGCVSASSLLIATLHKLGHEGEETLGPHVVERVEEAVSEMLEPLREKFIQEETQHTAQAIARILPVLPEKGSMIIDMDSAGGRVKDRLGRGAVVEAMEATLQGMQRVAVVMEGAESTRGLRELMTVVLRGVEEHLHSALDSAAHQSKAELDGDTEHQGQGMEAVPATIRLAVTVAGAAHSLLQEQVGPLMSHDVREEAALHNMVKQFDLWIDQAAQLTIAQSLKGTLKKAEKTLASLQKPADFLHPSASAGEVPTAACKGCIAVIQRLSEAWWRKGPPADQRGVGKGSGKRLDGNTASLLMQLATGVHGMVRRHLAKFSYSPVGGVQLLRDLSAFQGLCRELQAPGVEHELETLREAASVLVMAPEKVVKQLEEGLWSGAVSEDGVWLAGLRSDWSTLSRKVKSRPHEPART